MIYDMKLAERALLERVCAPLIDRTKPHTHADIELLREQTKLQSRSFEDIDHDIVQLVRGQFGGVEAGLPLLEFCAKLTELVEEFPTRTEEDGRCPDPPIKQLVEFEVRFVHDERSALCAAWKDGWHAGARSKK